LSAEIQTDFAARPYIASGSSLARAMSGMKVMSMPCAPSPLRMKALNELNVKKD
jgi:hypothetical protein